MTAKKKTVDEEPKIDLIKARKEGHLLMAPIQRRLEDLTVDTEEEYLEADALLARTQEGRKLWLSRVNPGIEHIRKGLQVFYDLRNEILEPMDNAAAIIKEKMKQFKLKEQRRLQAEEEERQRLIRQAEEEAQRKAEMAERAKSQSFKEKLVEQRAEAEQRAEDLRNQGPAEPVKGSGSLTKKVKKWRINDLALFLNHLLEQDSDDLMSLIMIDQVQMNAKFKLEGPELGKWMPGIEVYEDIDITGRGR